MDNKTYLLLNDRAEYNAVLLNEIQTEKDVDVRIKAVNDYVKANNGKDDKIAALKAVVAKLPAEDRAELAAAAKKEITKTAAGEQKVAYRRDFEIKEAKETFDFFYKKEKGIYAAVTGKQIDEEALVVEAAKAVAPAQTPEQLAKTEADIRKNIADMAETNPSIPQHNVENDKPADLVASMVKMLASYEKGIRGRVAEDAFHAEYMSYVTARQKIVSDVLSGNDVAKTAALTKKMQQSR